MTTRTQTVRPAGRRWHPRLILPALLLFAVAGCGPKPPPPREQTEPFRIAATEYLARQHLSMKIVEFRSLEVTNDSASAVALLKEAEDLYDLKVRWEFTFRRDGDAWTATGYRQQE